MNSKFLTTISLIFLSALNYAQSIELVEDYIVGTESSIEGRLYQFQNTLVYRGSTVDGKSGILQYDKEIEQISVLATNEDFLGKTSDVYATTEEILISTIEESNTASLHRIYQSESGDLSDLKLWYQSTSSRRRFRRYNDHQMIAEEFSVNGESHVDIHIIDRDANTDDFLLGLPGSLSEYFLAAVNDHFLVAPRVAPINGQSLVAYSIKSKSMVPITDVIPNYQECGLLLNLRTLNDNIIQYHCETTVIYEIATNQYITTLEGPFGLAHDDPEFIYVIHGGKLSKLIKSTGALELIDDNILTFHFLSSALLYRTDEEDRLEISFLDYESDQKYTYATDFKADVRYWFRGAISPEGIYFMIYEVDKNDGVLAHIDDKSFTVIDSVFDITTIKRRPVAYDGDIYCAHQDPQFGSELFVIDSDVLAIDESAHNGTLYVSPSPTSTRLTINDVDISEPSTIRLINQSGSVVHTMDYTKEIDVHTLPHGLYYLLISSTSGATATTTFMKN